MLLVIAGAFLLVWFALGALVLARSLTEQSKDPVPDWAWRYAHLAKGRVFSLALFFAIAPPLFIVVRLIVSTAFTTFILFFGETSGNVFVVANLFSAVPALVVVWRSWRSIREVFG